MFFPPLLWEHSCQQDWIKISCSFNRVLICGNRQVHFHAREVNTSYIISHYASIKGIAHFSSPAIIQCNKCCQGNAPWKGYCSWTMSCCIRSLCKRSPGNQACLYLLRWNKPKIYKSVHPVERLRVTLRLWRGLCRRSVMQHFPQNWKTGVIPSSSSLRGSLFLLSHLIVHELVQFDKVDLDYEIYGGPEQ